MILSVVFTVRYLVWRAGDTLNFDALWFSIPFLGAEIHGFIETLMYFFMVWAPSSRKRLPPLDGRTVDILVPTFNEPIDILRMTFMGCSEVRYPHTTYVLDDGKRPEVRALAEEFGFVYLTRADRVNAKAGNLNNGLSRSSGEFILTLDADYIAMPSIVDEAIGFFADEKVAFVQMPQDFYNIDSFEHATDWKRRYSWQEQELFHSVIQPGKDRWNAAFFCGCPTLLRRKALEDIGGFAVESVTEDLLTSIKLHMRGWKSVYYNKTLAWGLAPATLRAYSTQRLRWGMGAMQIFKSRFNPLLARGLSLPQRISYFASMFTYFLGFQKLIFILTPVVLLLTGVLPIRTEPLVFANYFIPYFLISVYALGRSQGGFRSIINIEQYNFIKMLSNIKAVFRGLFGKPEFLVTPKGAVLARNTREIAVQIALIVLSAAAVVIGQYMVFTGRAVQAWLYVIALLWAAYYIILASPIILTALRKLEFRRLYRFGGNTGITVQYEHVGSQGPDPPGSAVAGSVSPRGCSILTGQLFRTGERLGLRLSLPTGVFGNIVGEVRRSTVLKGSKGGVKYNTGIEFMEIEQAAMDEITRFLLQEMSYRQAELLRLSWDTRVEHSIR